MNLKVFAQIVVCTFAVTHGQIITLPAAAQIGILRSQIANCVGNFICGVTQSAAGVSVQCIDADDYCDGTTQCTNGADEHDCPGDMCVGKVICPDRKTCANLCDGIRSCANGEDEDNCATKCAKPQMLCSDYKTCATACDEMFSCPDNADEQNCSPKCEANEMLCADGKSCGTPCDKHDDCAGAGDEVNCPFQCRCQRGEYICKASDKCLPREHVCEKPPSKNPDNSCFTGRRTGDDERNQGHGTKCE